MREYGNACISTAVAVRYVRAAVTRVLQWQLVGVTVPRVPDATCLHHVSPCRALCRTACPHRYAAYMLARDKHNVQLQQVYDMLLERLPQVRQNTKLYGISTPTPSPRPRPCTTLRLCRATAT